MLCRYGVMYLIRLDTVVTVIDAAAMAADLTESIPLTSTALRQLACADKVRMLTMIQPAHLHACHVLIALACICL